MKKINVCEQIKRRSLLPEICGPKQGLAAVLVWGVGGVGVWEKQVNEGKMGEWGNKLTRGRRSGVE